ncbi:adenylate/guanylate cyclase domain-containing protein [Hoyosella sp. G463]|uniref:Adenylate/guanylate cyclase domain-containing protein n=1 Tax=Lolliginicoccus lacisalsi TaxID=2742202 RepID=A0A927PKI9_9ACTN|nr:adenylate/guanylate cyclase domain-containing protein [Lolliginicoccus lacisalsi]MBD8506075.1 adenylate/guanylate cyclase domain-containing protein [Lolliginicoccus lacisalsi]
MNTSPSGIPGSWLLGEPADHPRDRVRIQVLLTTLLLVANGVGVASVIAYLALVVPGPMVLAPRFAQLNFIAVPTYLIVAFLLGSLVATHRATRELRWAIDGTVPDEAQQQSALAMPWRLTRIQAGLWLLGTILFALGYASVDASVGIRVGLTAAGTTVVVSVMAYLLSEFALRPAVAKALAANPAARKRAGTISVRTLIGWVVGTAVPVVALMVLAAEALLHDDLDRDTLAFAILATGVIVLVFGALLAALAGASVVASVKVVRDGMARIEAGDLEAQVPVFDGTELGDLQSGFNSMSRGLSERSRLRDLFDRHLGQQLARHVLESPGKQHRTHHAVAALCIDLAGPTSVAEHRPAEEVVALLDRIFAIVVEEAGHGGGFVNKFAGDSALVVFGAPDALEDPAGSALATARGLASKLGEVTPRPGLGISYGHVIAAIMGSSDRSKYTVVGDPVNAAALLAQHARSLQAGGVASGSAIAAASSTESNHWKVIDRHALPGRSSPTYLAIPSYLAAGAIEPGPPPAMAATSMRWASLLPGRR